jgi:hypothetical protein
VAAAEADRDQAGAAARQAEQDAARAQSAETAARPRPTGPAPMPGASSSRPAPPPPANATSWAPVFEARAAAIEEARADLRARADRAETDADTLRAELARARAVTGPPQSQAPRRPRRRRSQHDQPLFRRNHPASRAVPRRH